MRNLDIFVGYDLTKKEVKKMFEYDEDKYDCFPYWEFLFKTDDKLKLKYKNVVELYSWPCCFYKERLEEGKTTFVIGYKLFDGYKDRYYIIDTRKLDKEKLKPIKDDFKLRGRPKIFCLPDVCHTCT
jgi:hypothetical protein